MVDRRREILGLVRSFVTLSFLCNEVHSTLVHLITGEPRLVAINSTRRFEFMGIYSS